MKLTILLLFMYYFASNTLYSQSFSVKVNPDSAPGLAGNTFKSAITILPEDGYNATVFLSVHSATLQSVSLSLSQINFPYSSEILLTVSSAISDTGIHTIIVEGRNGAFSVQDTMKLELTSQNIFKFYKTNYIIHTLAVTRDNVIYGVSYSKQNFLGKVENEAFKFAPAWESFVEENMFSSRRLVVADKSDNLWVMQAGQLGKFDGKFWTVYTVASHSSGRPHLIRDLLVDSSNRVWYHTIPDDPTNQYSSLLAMIDNGATVRMDSSIREFLTKTKKPTYITVDDMVCDIDGAVWVTATVAWEDLSKTFELLRYKNMSWENVNYPKKDSVLQSSEPTKYNYLVISPKGGMYMTTYNSLFQPIQQSAFINDEWSDNKYSKYELVYFTFDYNGRAWYLTNTSFRRWEGTDWVSYSLPFSIPGGKTDMKSDYANNIWIATGGTNTTGVIVYNPDGLSQQVIAGISEFNNAASSIESILTPNPAHNQVIIHYSLKNESPVSISIYNSLGIEVFKNNFGFKNAGDNSEIISTSELPSGQYYYVLKAGAQQSMHPLVIVQ